MKKRINTGLLGIFCMIFGVVLKIMDDILSQKKMEEMVSAEVKKQLNHKHKIQ